MSMRARWEQHAIRREVFHWLSAHIERTGRNTFTRLELSNFEYRGKRIPLLDASRGIRNPADFDATLSIMTSASRRNPYADRPLSDGVIRYHYQSSDGGDNRKLLAAVEQRVHLVYFQQIVEYGPFYAYFPMRAYDDPASRTITLAFADDPRFAEFSGAMPEIEKRYAARTAFVRLHQPRFREIVLRAYQERCSVCGLGQVQLLDAAHITADADPESIAHISNGLAMCKLHHAAYDTGILGVGPDYEIRIRPDIASVSHEDILWYTLQQFDRKRLRVLPVDIADWPDRARLAIRFQTEMA
ncbi:HNH endonuclease [Leifsonia xyli]|uniref:HNH endonuclease n=1 Tax=Leifsonia xyli TaxID=1575 RepID=UPI003D67B2CF